MPKHIILADDDAGIVEAVKLALEEEGYTVTTTADGDCLKELSDDLPDLVLLDIWMSGTDGRDLAKHIKSREETKGVPIIMVSANRDCQAIASEVGAEDYIEKPFDLDELLGKVARLVSAQPA
jgi:DNA-binding response OmpR family regulator